MFWIYAVILTLIALAMILPPLLRKTKINTDNRRDQNIQIAKEQLAELETAYSNKEMDDDAYLARRDELEQALYTDVSELEDNKKIEYAKPTFISALLVALAVPAIALAVYSQYGNPKASDPETQRITSKVPTKANGEPDIDAMVAGLRQKLDADPDNPEGWYMMGRSYMALKRYKEATEAYEQLLKLQPNDAKVMLFLADAAAMANDGNVSGRPSDLIEKSLQLDPNNVTGLWLGGMAAQQQGQHDKAIQRWETLIPLLENESGQVAEVRQLIKRSKQAISADSGEANTTNTSEVNTMAETTQQTQASTDTANNQTITVTVSLSDELKSKASDTDTVFIYAKATSGPPMPLAAKRLQVKDLPITVILDDSSAMMPSMKLSNFPQVTIGARVSKSGNAISANGDLYTEKSPVEKGAKQSLIIDSILQK